MRYLRAVIASASIVTGMAYRTSFLAVLSSMVALGGGVALTLGPSACSNSVCPFPSTSAASIDPPQPCLETKVDSCVRPTITVRNKCTAALYMPIDFGVFPADATAGSDVEVLPNATIQYEVRDDKATAKTATKKDYEIPARLGPTKLTFRFDTTSGK